MIKDLARDLAVFVLDLFTVNLAKTLTVIAIAMVFILFGGLVYQRMIKPIYERNDAGKDHSHYTVTWLNETSKSYCVQIFYQGSGACRLTLMDGGVVYISDGEVNRVLDAVCPLENGGMK